MIELAPKRLIWVCPDALEEILDSATWLETTRGLEQDGWSVTLLTGDKSTINEIQGVKVEGIGQPSIFLIRQIYYHIAVILRILSAWRETEVVFFHAISVPWMLPLLMLRWLTFQRFPLFIMDTRTVPMTDLKVARFNDRIRMAYYNNIFGIATKLFDGQTAITARLANAIGIPPSKLLCEWSSGVSLDRFSKHAALVENDPIPDVVKISYVGTLGYERNIHIFCQAILRACNEGMIFKFQMVGSGLAEEILGELARKSNGAIEMLPPVSHEEIPEVLASNHIGVLPFPDDEKFRVSSPIKLFEYMAAGMPILATRIVCHTDVIEDGAYAFWAEDATEDAFFNALREIWASRERFVDMGKLARQSSLKWAWSTIAQRLSGSLEKKIISVSKGGLRHENSHVQ